MMNADAELPPNFEWYQNQIAGHHPSVIRNGVRQIGILKELGRSDIILKLMQEGARGERELALYQTVGGTLNGNGNGKMSNEGKAEQNGKAEDGALLEELCRLMPRFHGCRDIHLDIPRKFIQIEDITQAFVWPCILDVKMGRVTYDPLASEEKKMAEESKSPLQKSLGFRILGYRNQTAEGVLHRDRVWGRERTHENIKQAFAEYLLSNRVDSLPVVEAFLDHLDRINDWFERQRAIHFYASSLLLVYEGHPKLPPAVDLRMIDFSHVFFQQPNDAERDENYIFGLVHIIKLFRSIRDDLLLAEKQCPNNNKCEMPNGLDKMQQNGGQCAAVLNANCHN